MVPDEKKAKETIDKAEAELKAGAPFETVVTKYSMDTPDPGKSLADTISKMSGGSLQSDDALKPLLKLKANQVSDVIKTDSGYGIYKVLSIDSTFKQAEFDKQKAELAKNFAQQLANKQVTAEIEKLKKDSSVVVKWPSKGYELLEQLALLPEQKLSLPDMNKRYEEIAKEASTATDAISPRALALARYVAFSSVWNSTSPDKRAALIGERVESINQVLQYMEGSDLRLELVDALTEQKKGPEATAALLEAAKFNSDLTPKGQSTYNSINARLLTLKDKNLLAAADEKSINDEQTRWKNDLADKTKAEAEVKKQEEVDRKRAEAERKKAEEEAKKPVKPVSRDTAEKANAAGATPPSKPTTAAPLDLSGVGKK